MHISSLVNSAYFKPLVLTKARENKSAADYTPVNVENGCTGEGRDFAVILELTQKQDKNTDRERQK